MTVWPPRPGTVVVVTGTGTEVGKTWVSAALIEAGRKGGLRVAARKPLQSYPPESAPDARDSARLAAASGEPEAVVCGEGRSFPAPLAPPMAAALLGHPIPSVAGLVSELAQSWPATGCDLAVVEGAGGVASPLADDGDTADLARALSADRVVVVSDPALGVIHSVRLCVRALHPLGVVVHLNRYEPENDLHRQNAAWLRERDGFAVTTSVADLAVTLAGPW